MKLLPPWRHIIYLGLSFVFWHSPSFSATGTGSVHKSKTTLVYLSSKTDFSSTYSSTTSTTIGIIDINADAKKAFKARLASLGSEPSSSHTIFSRVDLSMNSLPVYDQGIHGTCATFAVTAALDATLFKSPAISQTCLLGLQAYNHTQDAAHFPTSGWDGAIIENVAATIKQNGYVALDTEKNLGCGGLHSYPQNDDVSNVEVSERDYDNRAIRLPISTRFETLLSTDNAFSHETRTDRLLVKVKQALKNGHRVVVGMALNPTFNNGFVGRYQRDFDSWIVTPSLTHKIQHEALDEVGFHAVLLYGYDDHASIVPDESSVDGNGNINSAPQSGVFKLRNSWGPYFGDNGDGYMTYDYFKLMVTEVVVVRASTDVAAQ